eukprot:3362391-Alexandrium_andersonii.AAC.1
MSTSYSWCSTPCRLAKRMRQPGPLGSLQFLLHRLIFKYKAPQEHLPTPMLAKERGDWRAPLTSSWPAGCLLRKYGYGVAWVELLTSG